MGAGFYLCCDVADCVCAVVFVVVVVSVFIVVICV